MCGGGDRNCNGVHKPTLKPAKKVTDTFSLKADLAVARGSNDYLATWTGTPEATTTIEYALINAGGAISGVIRTVPNREATAPQAVFSPQRNAYGLSYRRTSDTINELNFVGSGGALELATPISLQRSYTAAPRTMSWVDGTFFVGARSCGPGGGQCNYPWYAVSEAGGVTETTLYTWASRNAVAGAGRVNVLNGVTVVKIDPADVSAYVTVALQGEHLNPSSAHLGWDGSLLVWATRDLSGVHYERFFPNGFVESTWPITTKALDPLHIAAAPASNGDPARVGVLLAEGTSNLYLFVRNQDGSEALPPGLVAGGSDVKDGYVFWDGQQFVVFWLAKVNQIHQVFTTTVSCE